MSTVAPVRTWTEGVAVVMPAYQEEENLGATVEDFLDTLAEAGHPHCVVVVNDGSPDRTGEVLDRLAARYPGRVLAVHHPENRGYGAAVRTGIRAALEQTDLRRLLLTDSDGQFRADDLLGFLAVQHEERADAVIGYRAVRADPLARRVNAALWTALSRLLLRHGSRDVDCAYKLIDRHSLDGIELRGEAAAISPELLAKIQVGRPRILHHPVSHYPRLHGDQTGARFSVILRSLLGLLRVYADLARTGHKWRRTLRLLHPKDPGLALVTLGALAVSVVGYLHFLHRHVILAYPDALSHVLIARRVVASPTAGAAQLGGVWLPLPHVLELPLVWVGNWYQSGFAGSVVSMAAFVLTARYLYLLTARMAGGSRLAGLTAAAVFAANVNAVYLQSTPMTETLLLACTAAAVNHLDDWCRTGRYGRLAACSVAVLLATLTRYEGWVLCVAVSVVVAYTALRRRRDYIRLEAHLIFYGLVALSGIAAWLVWNAAIFHNPMYWQDGSFAKPSLWVAKGEPAIGHPWVALHTYLIAMVDDIGLPALVVAGCGLLLHLARTRLRPGDAAPYALLALLPFYAYALWSGQRPLHVPQISGSLYNVRFGIAMLLPTAVFAGYLVSLAVPLARAWRRPRVLVPLTALIAAGVVSCAFWLPGLATLDEALAFRAAPSEQANTSAAAWLHRHYDGGTVLMESFGNEAVTFESGIPTQHIVYEGSFRMWQPALTDPAAHGIRWIYLRRTPGTPDDAYLALKGNPELSTGYRLVYQDVDRVIYQKREAAR
ncbi:glycosyltransferase involved in cell wall biosynthesis [Streptacidiphilus sp. MAP12-16]|uniref:glycosyltransferase family 2 protein n=1 Tax=Streptacidiphilus sp. MAP12-16 TaxID=3156300 RepID=UPI0035182EF6